MSEQKPSLNSAFLCLKYCDGFSHCVLTLIEVLKSVLHKLVTCVSLPIDGKPQEGRSCVLHLNTLQLWRFSAYVGFEIKWVGGNTMMLLNTDFLLFFLPRGLRHYVPAPPCNYFLDNLFIRQQHGPSRDPGSLSSRLGRCSARGNKFSFRLEKDKIQNSRSPQTSSPVMW